MKRLCVELTVVFMLCTASFVDHIDATRCLKCEKAVSIDDCTEEIECDATEECYLEKVTTPALELVLNAGCKSKTVCKIVEGLIGRKRSVGCFECCDSIRCNANLCLQVGSKKDNCGVCDAIHDFKSCSTFTKCQDDEVCSLRNYVNGNRVLYDVGCNAKVACYQQAVEKQKNGDDYGSSEDTGFDICTACCTGDRCNVEYDDCHKMFAAMTPANFTS